MLQLDSQWNILLLQEDVEYHHLARASDYQGKSLQTASERETQAGVSVWRLGDRPEYVASLQLAGLRE